MSADMPSLETDRASRLACEQRLRTVFAGAGHVWITDEQFDSNGPVWRVTLVCQGEAGTWWRRRYRYDIPSDTLHFAGQTPLSDTELRAARTSGRKL